MIRKKIKSATAVLITTVFVYVTYDNLQRIEAERSLPVGVTEIKITNWTKTREPNEISGGEKKLNSHSDLADLNKNISAEDVDSLEGLYNDSDELRSISYVTRSEVESNADHLESNVVNNSDNTEEIVDNKVDNTAVEDITDMDVDKSMDTNTNIDTDTNNEIQETIDTKITDNKENNTDKSSTIEKPSVTVAENNSNTEENNNTTQVGITGNKVLRTIVDVSVSGYAKMIRYNIDTLYEYLKSDKPINWGADDKITWDLYTAVDSMNKRNSIEWRMLSAKINISQQQKELLSKGQAVLGIPSNNEYGFELIMPYNDIVSVFINKNTTNINYKNRNSIDKYMFNKSKVTYNMTSDNKCYNTIYHKGLCTHTDGYHIDTGMLSEENLELIDASITDKLVVGENTIDILVGNLIMDQERVNNSCGFSKLSLYIIEKPKMRASMEFYQQVDGEIVCYDNEYLPKLGEKVFVRVDIENNSDKLDLNNLNIYLKFLNIEFKTKADEVTYRGKNISDKIRCYINEDFSKEYTSEALKELKAGDKLTIMSDELNYTITKTDVDIGFITPSGTFKANYIRDDLTHGYYINKSPQKKIQLSRAYGILNFTCSIQAEEEIKNESFIVNISSDNEFTNLEIQPGKTSTVKNLNTVGTDYYINLIVPQNYEVVDTDTYSSAIQNKVRLTQNSTVKNIHIKLKRKNNNYFYKNQQGCVNIKVE